MPQIKQTTVAVAAPKGVSPRGKALRADLRKRKNSAREKKAGNSI